MDTFDFSVAATFHFQTTVASFAGSYAAGGAFSLSAVFASFSLNSVLDIFLSMTGNYIALPDVDVQIESASVVVASGTGLTIQLQKLVRSIGWEIRMDCVPCLRAKAISTDLYAVSASSTHLKTKLVVVLLK